MSYREKIAEVTEANPAHVEAWMRAEYGTLDALSPREFRFAAREFSVQALMFPEESAKLAATYGL